MTRTIMKTKLFFVFFLSIFTIQTISSENNPKWLEKAERAVFSIITYDNQDKILNNGNGFFISSDGIALSDYTTFKGAKRAVVVMSDGKQYPITLIMGANDLYDVIKFRVGIAKSVNALSLAKMPGSVGSDVYLIPYSTQKSRSVTSGKVNAITKVESKYNYYTLSYNLDDKMISCPIANNEGEVIALAQKSTSDKTISYGLDATFGSSLSIGLLGSNDANLKAIGIKKDLPDEESQALVSLYMSSSMMSNEEYAELLNDFVSKFPNSADGYLKRAENEVRTDKDGSLIDAADKDLASALKVTQHRDDALYNAARLIFQYLQTTHQTPYKEWTLDKALGYIREAISINPLPVYIQTEGDLLFAQKNYNDALTSFQKVNKSNLVSAASYYSTALTMQMLKLDQKEIVAMMDSCINMCSKPITRDASAYLLARAQVYMDAGMFRPALLDYNTYYDAVNGNVNDQFYFYREQAANKAKQYQQALDDIQAAIDHNPKEMLYRVEQGAMNLRVGRVETAVKQLQEAIKIDPKYAEVYRILGLCQIEQKKKEEACANFAKAKELGDENAQAMIDKYCK